MKIFSEAIPCADRGYVRLVDHMGDDSSVVRAARVSYNAEPRGDGSDEKLIHYLMKHRHTTPFESVVFTFEVKAPLFVLRQWHRHRTWSYNEISARYSELPEEFYIPAPEDVGVQSAHNKQVRDLTPADDAVYEARQREIEQYTGACARSFETYAELLRAGWPREVARACLPVSTYSRMFATVDLHNLFHFLGLRLHPHAQHEIRIYAQAMLDLIRPVVPISVAAWEEANGRINQPVSEET